MSRKSDGTDFVVVMQANKTAFEAMGNIRPYASNGQRDDLVDTVNTAFGNVSIMAAEYIKHESKHRMPVRRAFTRAYNNALGVIDTLKLLSSLDSTDTLEFQKMLSDDYKLGLYNQIESLPAEFEGEEPDYKLRPINTLHGLIRFFHQKIIDFSFDPAKLKDCPDLVHYELNKGDFKFMDLDNQINPDVKGGKQEISRKDIYCRPMQAIFDFYHLNVPSQQREYYHAFLKKDTVNFHMLLNMHSAEIDAKLSGDNSFVKFSYREYLNSAWRDRIDYICEGMRYLGFDIKNSEKNLETDRTRRSNAIVAEKLGADEQSIYGTLTELARLLASTTHINCAFESARGLVTAYDALKCFFNGKTDISSFIYDVSNEASSLPPRPPRQEDEFASKFKGRTYEAKIANANNDYAQTSAAYWEGVERGEIDIGETLKKVRALPSLDKLVKKRLAELKIKK